MVLKIFVIQDPTLSLDAYRKHVEGICEALKDAPNCIPFRRTIVISVLNYGIIVFVTRNFTSADFREAVYPN